MSLVSWTGYQDTPGLWYFPESPKHGLDTRLEFGELIMVPLTREGILGKPEGRGGNGSEAAGGELGCLEEGLGSFSFVEKIFRAEEDPGRALWGDQG